MNSKCHHCGLVNFAGVALCRRCGSALADFEPGDAPRFDAPQERGSAPRSLARRMLAGLGLSALLVFIWYVSLLESSAGTDFEQRQAVTRAVTLIERSGFERDAFLLRRIANYRTTDNWWNAWAGHADAYAATNFPFGVVTLYPDFFDLLTDDVERAIVLLHEARHLAGGGEEHAHETVWRDRARLGWTRERYGETRLWQNVREYTERYAPHLFRCGSDGREDCTE